MTNDRFDALDWSPDQKSSDRPSGRSPMTRVVGLLVASVVLTVVIAVAIWPGEMKLLEPLFCTDAQPDAFVVTDSYQIKPGETSYSFTMYCMGPRGDVTAIPQWKPYLTLFAIHTALLLIPVALLARSGKRDRSTLIDENRRPAGSNSGPFVD